MLHRLCDVNQSHEDPTDASGEELILYLEHRPLTLAALKRPVDRTQTRYHHRARTPSESSHA